MFLPPPFVCTVDPAAVFEGGDSLVNGVFPGLAVSKSRPLAVVDVTSAQGLFRV